MNTGLEKRRVDLAAFDNTKCDYVIGRSLVIQLCWFLFGSPIVSSSVMSSSAVRVKLLKIFGARLGKGVVIKPRVRIKFPWKLSVGDHSWLGEDCWIDNLAPVSIGDNVCISQGAYLCTGSHDWSDSTFGLIVRRIEIEDGAWIAAKATLAPGTTVETHAVVGLNAMASGRISAYQIYLGNPAKRVFDRPLWNFAQGDSDILPVETLSGDT